MESIEMNFLITGGAGSVGRDLTASLLEKGHRVRVLDKHAETFGPLHAHNLELIPGRLEDVRLVQGALQGVDVVIHLAWSFSDDPVELLESDLKGHVVLLEGCVAARVSRLFYASTAVVYGKPGYAPITEEAPCLVEEARKPFYAIAKLTAEKLALAYWKMKGLPVTVFRFWWAYGDTIGGSHLRELIRKSLQGQPLEMVRGAGGTFITMKDLEAAILLAISNDRAAGQIYNVGSLFLTWEEIGRMIISLTNSCSALAMKTPEEWQGPAFLNEVWDLAWKKAEAEIGYKPENNVEAARAQFRAAISAAVAKVEAEEKGAGKG